MDTLPEENPLTDIIL